MSVQSPSPDDALREKISGYIEAAYLHSLPTENMDTGELEPPADIADVAWITDSILHLLASEVAEKVREAEQRTHNIYRKELDHLQRQVELYEQRDQLKIEPRPMVIEVKPKSHTYLIGDQDEPNDNKRKG